MSAAQPPGATGTGRLELTAEHDVDQYQPDADSTVRVTLRVAARGLRSGPGGALDRSEIIIIDCSGSMTHPTFRKIGAARRAAAEVIEMLPDGTHFALVEGTGTARVVYPWATGGPPSTVAATADTRAQGSRVARTLDAFGGTRISAWLELARALLVARPNATLRHVLVLTDGRDEHESVDELRRVLDRCASAFTCDALGIGEDWDAGQLTEIVTRLGGRAEAVETVEPGSGETSTAERLSTLFRELVAASTSRTLPELVVRVRTAPHVRITSFAQLNPTERAVPGTVVDPGPAGVGPGDDERGSTVDYPTGAWGDEERWFVLHLQPTPGPGTTPGGPPVPLAWVGLAADDVELPEEQCVRVRWTNLDRPLTDLNPASEHFRTYTRLNEATRLGADALTDGDQELAVEHLGTAVRLAHRLGDQDRLGRLNKLVDILDAQQGRVRLRSHPEPQHLQSVIVSSVYTRTPPPGDAPSGPVTCPHCLELVPSGTYCADCGRRLGRPR